MKNAWKVLAIVGIIVIFIVISVISWICNGMSEFFSFNLVEILTLGIASILIYYLTEKNNDKRKKNEKIENLIIEISSKLNSISLQIPSKEKQKEYLYCFKYISNKFNVLKLLIDKDDERNLENAEKEFENLRVFITDNINQDELYFENLKDKIPNYVSNIDTFLDKIIVNIYKQNSSK